MKKLFTLAFTALAMSFSYGQFKVLNDGSSQVTSTVANWGRAFSTYVYNPQTCAYHLNYDSKDRFYVCAQGWMWCQQGGYIGSDASLKQDVVPITDALDLIFQLQGVQYSYIDEPNRQRMGFIAQDMEDAIPDMVRESQYDGLKGISYTDLIALLVEGIKEMQSQMQTMETVMYSQEQDLITMKNQMAVNGGSGSKTASLSTTRATLYDNAPNPFDTDTEIKYYIPPTFQSASIMIHDMQGGQISAHPIQNSGHDKLLIHGSQMKPGMYLYTLIVDGKVIDSKRMILVD